MDPYIGAAAINAGAQLLGGLFGGGGDPARNNRRQTIKLHKTAPRAIREGAEKAGFNPLVFAAPQGNVTGGAAPNVMGDAIARAGLAVADGMTEKRELDMQRAELELERERLELLRQEIKLTPNVPGIYGPSPAPVSPKPVQVVQSPARLQPATMTASPAAAVTPAMPGEVPMPDNFPREVALSDLLPDTSQEGGGFVTPRGWQVSTDRMTSEDAEKFYHEAGGAYVGFRNSVEDIWRNYAPTPWKDGVSDFYQGKTKIGNDKWGIKFATKEEREAKGRYPNKDNALWWLDHIFPNY